jgi:two-component system C4-dicarboxylate transport sensor histidine kinase DctB
MFEFSRPLRLTVYTVVIIAGAALVATLAMRHTVRQSMIEDAARANQQLAPCPRCWRWTRNCATPSRAR